MLMRPAGYLQDNYFLLSVANTNARGEDTESFYNWRPLCHWHAENTGKHKKVKKQHNNHVLASLLVMNMEANNASKYLFEFQSGDVHVGMRLS